MSVLKYILLDFRKLVSQKNGKKKSKKKRSLLLQVKWKDVPYLEE